MFDWIADPNAWVAQATLTALEIVLGVDNIIFISIPVGRLPPDKRDLARRLGLTLAMVTRIALLLSLAWIMQLTQPLFTAFGHAWSGRDVILIGGGLVQIAVIDIVFSLDSVITAVGLADDVMVMAVAIVASVGVMMFAARPIGDFVDTHPTIKILALAFLVLVGVALVAEGFGTHVPKSYIYFAMAFSFAVEMINIRMRRRVAAPVQLRKDLPGE
jgi:predicted tellurium resistance membrane protein TerC